MNTALWIVAGFLTVLYLFSGFVKLLVPREKMAEATRASEWVVLFPANALKAIGAAEILAAVGLLLPALLDIAPVLVPLAASGLVCVMTGAVIMRIRRREPIFALVDLFYLALCAFVAIGRFGPESF